MKLLAIDTSGKVASVAIIEDQKLIGEYTINYKLTHSQTLMPILDDLLKKINLDLSVIDAFAIASGPGSFTGLRISSATIKGFGLALNKPIISVPTIDAMAMNLWGCEKIICPLIDARRQQVYTGLYHFKNEKLVTIQKQSCCMIYEIINKVNEIGMPVIFLGDGVAVNQSIINELMNVPYSFAPAHCNEQHASCVADLGYELYMAGQYQNAVSFRPEYLRLSQAEQENVHKDFLI